MTDEITLDAPETRIERFLAAAAGVEGITLDEPETRIERYLYKIAQGSGGVPAVEDADKGKYLHANESTGDLEWAEGGSGGGVLVVTDTTEGQTSTLDKTWAEINAADCVVIRYNDGSRDWRLTEVATGEGKGGVAVSAYMGGAIVKWESETESGYPTREA